MRSLGNSVWACLSCVSKREPIYEGFASTKEMVKLKSMSVPRKWLDELERRVILPYEKKGGGYYIGRRGENGKIQERSPRYHF